MSQQEWECLSSEKQEKILELLQAEKMYIESNKLTQLYPKNGPFRRDLYTKHMEFYSAGKAYQERCVMGGNRTGKTLSGAYESTLHLTGLYPKWWNGLRFDHPTDVWVAGKTNETTRDIIQLELMGHRNKFGTGLIPASCISDARWKSGVSDLLDTIKIKHVTGEFSSLGFKSYQQGRDGFEGTAKHFIWLDEEPPRSVYEECLLRTMTTEGSIILTFTPLQGMSETVMSFLPKEYQLEKE